jgi:hypothetical protein
MAQQVLSIGTASTKQNVTRRHHFSESRMPLLQPPAEQPYRFTTPNWNPVSNDRVFPHLGYLLLIAVSFPPGERAN